MGKVLVWLLGVPVTVAALFAVFGEQSNATSARDGATYSNMENKR